MRILGAFLIILFAIAMVVGGVMWTVGRIKDRRSRNIRGSMGPLGMTHEWDPSQVKPYAYDKAQQAARLVRWGFFLSVGSFFGIIFAAQLMKVG